MEGNLGPKKFQRKTGNEKFTLAGREQPFTVLDFWQWSSSDLLTNVLRGSLAEFIVAQDMGIDSEVREVWEPYDLLSDEGYRIEVKSSSYLQSWGQEQHSTISFSIAERLEWDYQTNKFGTEKKRNSDIYVFCLLCHKDKDTVDPIDLSQWTFFVVPTRAINQKLNHMKKLGMKNMRSLEPKVVKYGGIKKAIAELADQGRLPKKAKLKLIK